MESKVYVLKRNAVLDYAVPIGVFAALMALSSKVMIPLPFTPVPITLQVLFVILSGFMLGSKRAAIAQASYLGLILSGLPLTAYGLAGPAAFLSPTAGYLIAFLPAAYLVGLYSEKYKSNFHFLVAGILGIIIIYLGGSSWLAIYFENINKAIKAGAAPFIIIDLIKAFIAVIIFRGSKSLWIKGGKIRWKRDSQSS